MHKKTTSEKWKFGSNKNYEWIGKTIQKKIRSKQSKKQKIKVKLPHVNKKTTSEKAKFCSNTDFLLYFKISVKK